MKLEGLVTCTMYADFLAATLPFNRHLFNHLVVVTSPDDQDTARICEYWNVDCLPTTAFNTHYGQFNKAAAINQGLERLSLDDWVLHFDADILFPPLMRNLLEQLALDPVCLYGCDRHVIPNEKALIQHLFEPKLQQENDVYVHLDGFPLSPRIAMSKHGGYVPIGFFQLWNPNGSGIRRYPVLPKTNGARTDTEFAIQWPRSERVFLPEFAVYHLESEPAPQGANWDGRTTRPFGEGCHNHRRPWHHNRHHEDHPWWDPFHHDHDDPDDHHHHHGYCNGDDCACKDVTGT